MRISGAGISSYPARAPTLAIRVTGSVPTRGLEEIAEDLWLRLSAHELDGIVDDDFGDRVHVVALGQLGKLARLHNIGPDMWIFDRQKSGQPGRVGTVGSSGCDEDLEMHVARHLR